MWTPLLVWGVLVLARLEGARSAAAELGRGLARRIDALAVVIGVGCIVAAVAMVDPVAGLASLGLGLVALGALGSRN